MVVKEVAYARGANIVMWEHLENGDVQNVPSMIGGCRCGPG
jgi:hypothetical protein